MEDNLHKRQSSQETLFTSEFSYWAKVYKQGNVIKRLFKLRVSSINAMYCAYRLAFLKPNMPRRIISSATGLGTNFSQSPRPSFTFLRISRE